MSTRIVVPSVLLFLQNHSVQSHFLSPLLHKLFSLVLSHPHSDVASARQKLHS